MAVPQLVARRCWRPLRAFATQPRAAEHDGTLSQRTLVLFKPDAVERRLVGRLLSRFEDRGLAPVAMRQRVAGRALAEAHYAEHAEKHFYERACVFLASGPLVSLVLEGRGAVRAARSLIGPTDPLDAAPGTIRGDYACHWRRNLAHASDSEAAAAREIALWFPGDDALSPPSTALEPWLIEAPGSRITFGA